MKMKLAENIKKLRRERKMTQEQLAEALGITTGAVHKWESGASMPEIRMLVELAQLYGVSVDVLLGYEMRDNSVDDILGRIREHLLAKDFASAVSEAEKALVRYPNDFRIVDRCADVYERKGIEEHSRADCQRAIELMERLIPLLPQNDDPEISEQTIRSEIAICHLTMGEPEKAVEILKRYNAGGINNTTIAMTCSVMEGHDRADTENYLIKSFSVVSTGLIKTMSAYINYYIRIMDIKSALDVAQWFIAALDSMKTDADTVCYTDKLVSTMEALSASFLIYLGRGSEAEQYMRSAYRRAAAFDASPVYTVQGLKFLIGEVEMEAISDDLGENAQLAIERLLRSDENNAPALELWESIKTE